MISGFSETGEVFLAILASLREIVFDFDPLHRSQLQWSPGSRTGEVFLAILASLREIVFDFDLT
jgi:hypothetical protein